MDKIVKFFKIYFIERILINMLKLYAEATLPKLSMTSLYSKFDQTSKLGENIKFEISHSAETTVPTDTIKELISLMRLNGDAIVKKAIDAYMSGDIVIIFNKETSKIPPNLPYIIMGYKGKPTAFLFADKLMNNITSQSEYTSLMAGLEASYLALELYKDPDNFLMNSQLMLTLCNIFTLMAVAPLEQRLYMKGDNLVKAMIYIISYFYKMIRGDTITAESIPFRRIISDQLDDAVTSQIVEQIKSSQDNSFIGVIRMISSLNPIRYKDLEAMYMSYFTSVCGISLIFALENISYLFLLITSSQYKTQLTAYGINKIVSMPVKKAIMLLTNATAS
jgi:hypothetical protein